jgi:flagellar hook assembly protein FlgD
MGDAVVAIVGGTHAIEWNPAGIARATVPMGQFGLGFNPSTSEFQFNTSVLYPLQDGTVFALSQYSDFPNNPTSNTTYIGSIGMPMNSSRDLFLGFNLKYMALSILNGMVPQNGRGLGFDLGLAYDLRNPQGTVASFGLAVQNVASDIRFDSTGEQPVTRTFTLGVAYQKIKDTRIEMDYDIIDQTDLTTPLHNRLRLGAERFLGDRFYSVRLGYDDLFNNDGYFSLGAGYHPNQPFELAYAFRISTTDSQSTHYLSFIYKFDDLVKHKNYKEKVSPTTSSPEININAGTNLTEIPPATGKPVSPVPLRKLVIQVDPPVFSPTGKQKITTISFPGDESGDISRWVIEFQSLNQKVVRRIGGTGPLMPFFAWDGINDDGKQVPEGKYKIALKTFNKKDEILSDDFENVEIISARSHFEILSNGTYFSTRPGQKQKKDIIFNVNPGGSSEVKDWEFEISDSSTKVIFETRGQNRLPKTIHWNGRDLKRNLVPDGNYLCLLIAQDKAGNPLKTDTVQVVISNEPPELTLKGEDKWVNFSTNKDFHILLNEASLIGLQSWKVSLLNENGTTIKTFGGNGQPPKEITWDGENDSGKEIEPGTLLKAVFTAIDKAGNAGITDPFSIQVEVQPSANGEQMTLNLTTVYFPALGTEVSDSSKKDIEKAATSIRSYINKSTLIIKGYASPNETGDLLLLSHERAQAVKAYLMKVLNISDNGIYAVGYGTKETAKSASPTTDETQRKAVVTLSTQP